MYVGHLCKAFCFASMLKKNDQKRLGVVVVVIILIVRGFSLVSLKSPKQFPDVPTSASLSDF